MLKMLAIGNLGKDAVVNTVNGKTVINFSLAHTEKYKDKDGETVEKTTWVDCSYWSEKTAVAPYLLKGTQVYVEGVPEVRMFERQNGDKGVSQVLRVMQVQLIGSKRAEGGESNTTTKPAAGGEAKATPGASAATGGDDMADDLPF